MFWYAYRLLKRGTLSEDDTMTACVGSGPSVTTTNSDAKDTVVRTLLIVSICFFLFVDFRIGIVRGVHDVVGAQSWGRILFAVGAAITEMAHGGYGYTTAEAVEAILRTNGLTDHLPTLARIGTTFPENLRDSQLIDSAMSKAVQFQWPFDPNHGVRGSGGDDLGFVDFAKISFHLFGYKILSLYLTFFIIQGLTALAFICAFWHRAGVLAILLVLTATEGAVFSSSLLEYDIKAVFGIGTVADPRVLSLLGLIPALHLACLMVEDVRPTVTQVLLTMFQCAVLVLTLWIRASVVWSFLALFLLSTVLAILDFRKLRSMSAVSRLWTLAVLFVFLGAHQTYVSMTLHPVYTKNNEIRHHVLWQSMFYSLAVHPDWPKKYAAAFDYATGDELPLVAAKKYLSRNPVTDPDSVYLTADRRYLKIGAAETYARKALFEFIMKDPVFVIEAVAVYNSELLYRVLAKTTSSLANMTRALKLTIIAAFLGVASLLAFRGSDLLLFARTALLLTGAFAFSLMPLVLTAPGYFVIADQFFLLLMVSSCWTVTILAVVVRVFGTGRLL